MTYPTISELEKRIKILERKSICIGHVDEDGNASVIPVNDWLKRIEQLETDMREKVFSNILRHERVLQALHGECERLKEHNQFLAKRLEAQSDRISVLEGHPKNYEKTIEG